jgi:hypothetical protein
LEEKRGKNNKVGGEVGYTLANFEGGGGGGRLKKRE